VNRRCVYCGHGRHCDRALRIGTGGRDQSAPASRNSRSRCQRSWTPAAADGRAGGLDQKDRTPPRKASLLRCQDSHSRSWPRTSKNTPVGHKARQFHRHRCRSLAGLREVRPVVAEDQGRSPVSFCEMMRASLCVVTSGWPIATPFDCEDRYNGILAVGVGTPLQSAWVRSRA